MRWLRLPRTESRKCWMNVGKISEIVYALEIAIIYTANLFLVPVIDNKYGLTVSFIYMAFT